MRIVEGSGHVLAQESFQLDEKVGVLTRILSPITFRAQGAVGVMPRRRKGLPKEKWGMTPRDGSAVLASVLSRETYPASPSINNESSMESVQLLPKSSAQLNG